MPSKSFLTLVPTAYRFVASLTPGCRVEVLLLWTGIVSTLGNSVPATLGTKLGVTFVDERSLMRLDAVVIASWNNSFILLIPLLRSVPCLESTIG